MNDNSKPRKTIVLAKQDLVTQYRAEIDSLLEILGHPEALVTDETTFADFFPFTGGPYDDVGMNTKLQHMLETNGVHVYSRMDMTLVDCAQLMRNSKLQ